MFKNSYRRSRQARNFTTNVPKILDLKSSSEQIFSENWLWVPLKSVLRSTNLAAASVSVISPGRSRGPIISLDTEGAFIPRNFCFNRVLDWKQFFFPMTSEVSEVISILFFRYLGCNRTKLYIECRIHVSGAFSFLRLYCTFTFIEIINKSIAIMYFTLVLLKVPLISALSKAMNIRIIWHNYW